MLRRTPLFQAVDPRIISSGLQPELHPLLAILWEQAENVVFYSGKVKRRVGAGLVYDAGDGDIRGLSQQQDTSGTRWIWSAARQVVQRWYGPTAADIYTFPTYQQDDAFIRPATFVDITHYGNWTILNNSVDRPVLHKPGVSFDFYGDAKPCVRFMKKLSFMLAIGTDARGTRVEFSDSANIEVFTASSINNAGGLSLDDFDTPIRAAAMLGSQIAVYSEDQMGMVNYIGAPFFFGQRTVLDGIGAVSKNAVCSDGKGNYGVGRNGVWWTDSNSFKYIDEGFLHDYLQENVNWTQSGKIFAVRNDFTGCMEFYFPMGVSFDVTEGWAFDPDTGGWSKLPPCSLKDERRLFQYPLIGALGDGKVLFDGSDRTVVTPLNLRTKPLTMQLTQGGVVLDVHSSSRIDEVELLIKKAQNVEWRLGSCMEWDGLYTWSNWQSVTTLSKTYRMGPELPDGVYWKLEFRSTANVWDFDLQGFLLFGQVEGSKRDLA